MNASPLRILFVTSVLPSPETPSRGTFVEALVRSWTDAGAHVSVIAPQARWHRTTTGRLAPAAHGRPARTDAGVWHPPFATFSAIRVADGISTRALTQWRFEQAAIRAAARIDEPFDLVYGHFLFPAGAATARIASGRGLPAVVAIGESDTGEWSAHFGRRRTGRLLRSLAGLVAVSDENARVCTDEYGVDPERLRVQPNAVDHDRFHPRDKATLRRELGLPVDRPVVVFVGHFIERKGPLRAMAALRHVPDAVGVFLGDGPQRPTGPQVHFAGPVPHADVARWMAAADLFLFPSLAEGSPNAALEAMASGLPVVASRIPAHAETIPDSAGILVDALDTAAFGTAARKILADTEMAAAMSRAGRERATSYTLNDRSQQLLEWLARRIVRR